MPARISRLLPGALFIVALLAAIEAIVDLGWVNRALLPPPSVIGGVLGGILGSGDFLEPLGDTLYRLAVGFTAGSLCGIGLGMLMGTSRLVFNLFEPLVELIRPIPKVALVPALVIFIGLGDGMKILSIGLAVFFPVLINTIQGVRGVDPVQIQTARTFGYGPREILWKVSLPAALPLILTGMRVSLGLGMILAVISEMIAGSGGIGFLILDMQRSFKIRQMYAWLTILAVVGFALNFAFVWIERRVLYWRPALDND